MVFLYPLVFSSGLRHDFSPNGNLYNRLPCNIDKDFCFYCIINLMLIHRFGVTGAAMANASDLILWNIVAMFFIKRYYDFYTVSWLWKQNN